MFYIFLAILGLIFGSFLGMLTYRLPRKQSVLGRSYCPLCKQKLSWYHNIPLLSYTVLRGKCANCKRAISLRYPIIEATTALSFVATGVLWSQQGAGFFDFLAYILLTFIFLALAIIDLERQILPDSLLIFLLLITFYLLLSKPSPNFFTNLAVGTFTFAVFLTLFLVTRGRGIGYGDVKLSFITGSLFGVPGVFVWFMLSFLSGAIVGTLLLALGHAKFGKPIPFGPFLLVSAWVTMFFGQSIWSWYLSLL